MNDVLYKLENIKFPKNKSRVNVSVNSTEAFAMGSVNYRGQKSLGGRTKGPSRFNKKFPELYESITDLIRLYKPDFKYTTVQVNKNVRSKPHVDKNNVGPSYIIALGEFTGGNLFIEGEKFNIKNKWKNFNGTLGHWVEPFEGTRYSLVYFTHTFKPPCQSLRHIEVKPDGLYKKNNLIKSYFRG
jgi:hypothetical protein